MVGRGLPMLCIWRNWSRARNWFTRKDRKYTFVFNHIKFHIIPGKRTVNFNITWCIIFICVTQKHVMNSIIAIFKIKWPHLSVVLSVTSILWNHVRHCFSGTFRTYVGLCGFEIVEFKLTLKGLIEFNTV